VKWLWSAKPQANATPSTVSGLEIFSRKECAGIYDANGVPPHRWLLHRIDGAKDLLRRSKLSLAEIALAQGFASEGHFIRAFTRAEGITPAAQRSRTDD
jgi:AraC-like DNA-binding protein